MSFWKRFQDRYPNANLSKFKRQTFFDKQIMFIGKDEDIQFSMEITFEAVFISLMKRKTALGMSPGLPLELTLNNKPDLHVPAVQFSAKVFPLSDAFLRNQV